MGVKLEVGSDNSFKEVLITVPKRLLLFSIETIIVGCIVI